VLTKGLQGEHLSVVHIYNKQHFGTCLGDCSNAGSSLGGCPIEGKQTSNNTFRSAPLGMSKQKFEHKILICYSCCFFLHGFLLKQILVNYTISKGTSTQIHIFKQNASEH